MISGTHSIVKKNLSVSCAKHVLSTGVCSGQARQGPEPQEVCAEVEKADDKQRNKFLSNGDKYYKENKNRVMEWRLTNISMEGLSKEIVEKYGGRTFWTQVQSRGQGLQVGTRFLDLRNSKADSVATAQ